MRSAVATVAAAGISRARAYELPAEMVSLVSSTTSRVKSQVRRYPLWMFGAAGGLVVVLVAALLWTVSRPHSTHPTILRAPTSTATAAATATPVEAVNYQDALTSNDHRWPVTSHCRYIDGGYEISGSFICYAPPSALGDATISVLARQVAGPTDQFYGILLRGVSDSHFYFFGVNARLQWTFTLVANGNGNPVVAPTTDSHIVAGLNANNMLTVRARGSHFIFYINGVQVGQANDTALSSGRMALTNPTGGVTAVYNDFKVTVPA
jgi:hypothetical protein